MGPDLISIRHDRERVYPDVLRNYSLPTQELPNPNRRGNALLIDGHAAYITRLEAHTARAVLPDAE